MPAMTENWRRFWHTPVTRAQSLYTTLFVLLVVLTVLCASMHLFILRHPHFMPNAARLFEAMRDRAPGP